MYSLSSANSYLQALVQQANAIKQEELNRLKQQSQPKVSVKYSPINRAALASLSKTKQQLSTRKVLGSFDNQTSGKFSYSDYYNQLKNQIDSFSLNNDSAEADRNITKTNINSLIGNKYTENPQETLVNYLKNKGYSVTVKQQPIGSYMGGINNLEVKDSSGKLVTIPISLTSQWLQPTPTWNYDSKLDPNKEYLGLYNNMFANKNIVKEYSALNSEINNVQNSIQEQLNKYDPTTKSNLMSAADMKSLIYFKSKLESLVEKRDEWADKVNNKFGSSQNNWAYFGNTSRERQPSGFEWDWFKQYQKEIKDTLGLYSSEFSKTLDNSQKLLSAFEATKASANKSVTDISNISLQQEADKQSYKKQIDESADYARQLATQRAAKISSMINEETIKKAAPKFKERPA